MSPALLGPSVPVEPGVTAAAIAALVPRLRRHAVALTGSLADGDDLVQDCLERALTQRGHLRDPARLYGWLLAILHNLHRGAWRSRQRHPSVSIDTLADSLALSAPPGERTAIRDLVRAMAGLSDDQRRILLLTALDGLSYREIAELLDLPMGTVMSRLARARDRLRVLLDGGTQQVVRKVEP